MSDFPFKRRKRGKEAYKDFLKTPFWRKLSARKKKLVGCCERCGCKSRLEAHHIRYPKLWEDTTLEDLEVLCRGCHAKEHGKPNQYFWMYGIDDLDRAIFLERCHMIHDRFNRPGFVLTKKIKKFLRRGVQLMPQYGCVAFQQKIILKLSSEFEKVWEGYEWRDGKVQEIKPPPQ